MVKSEPSKKLTRTGERDRDFIKSLLELLGRSRIDEYNFWSKLCWILQSEYEDYYDIFLEWSRDSCKFDESHCQKLWDRADRRDLTIATLRYWAKEDSPEEYEKLSHRSEYHKQIDEICRSFIKEINSDEFSEKCEF